MEELKLAIKQYLESREKLQDCLSNVEINKAANSADSATLLSIINDSFFEAKAFELLLHTNADEAKRHINLFYLQGSPQQKTRFKGELDIMLDDYRCILGEMEFKKLIDSLPKENKEFYAIKEAIEFAQSE
ncbi:MAG: hypothetical protein HXN63_06695 [Prevotella pallens]|jgi:hypothetical protein|nr:hypothetical protein [Prevotella pallens]